MNRVRKLSRSAAAAVTVAAGITLLAPASLAQAAPSCQVGGGIGQAGGSGWARCTGVSSARVELRCVEAGTQTLRLGAWVGPGSTSSAQCSPGAVLASVSYQYQL